MASNNCAPTFVCSCFFTDNIFVKKYKLHVSYTDKSKFLADYSGILRNRGCVTGKQFDDVITEIETEVSRRRLLGAASLVRREEIRDNYVPLHEEVYQLQESNLDPEFISLVSAAKGNKSVSALMSDHMENLGEEVYAFPVFTPQYCRLLLEELEHIEQSDCPKERPNTMIQHGIQLNEFNFNPGLLDPLRLNYLQPITSLLYPTWGGHALDSHKAFTVHYEPHLDRELSCHFDNAEVTLNVALGSDNFVGGDLYFMRWDSDVDLGQQTLTRKHKHHPGWGVLHRGLHQHGAEAVTSGKRCNLIMWMRSSSVRNTRCPMCRQTPRLMQVPGLDEGFTCPPPPVVNVCEAM